MISDEIESGQTYTRATIGAIRPADVVTTSLISFLDATQYVVDVLGSCDYSSVIQAGYVMAEIRECVRRSDWSAVNLQLHLGETEAACRALTAVRLEVARLSSEVVCIQACDRIAAALHIGSAISVRDYAILISLDQKQSSSGSTVPTASLGKAETTVLKLKSPKKNPRHRRHSSMMVLESSAFVDKLISLKSSLEKASLVNERSDRLESLLHMGGVILNLRSGIYESDIRLIEYALMDSVNCTDLVGEELATAESALMYAKAMTAVNKGLLHGNITGAVGRIDKRRVSCSQLERAEKLLSCVTTPDRHQEILCNLCQLMARLRRSVLVDRWESTVEGRAQVQAAMDALIGFHGRFQTLKDFLIIPEDNYSGSEQHDDWLSVQLRALESASKEIEIVSQELQDIRCKRELFRVMRDIPREVLQLSNLRKLDFFVGSRLADESLDSEVLIGGGLSCLAVVSRTQLLKPLLTADTQAVLLTAEFLSAFREQFEAGQSISNEGYKSLVERATNALQQGLCSQEGSNELNAYCSTAMSIRIVQADIISAIEAGAVAGSLEVDHTNSLDVSRLQQALAAGMALVENSNSLTTGLADLVAEASLVCSYRIALNFGDYTTAQQLVNTSQIQARDRDTFSFRERSHVMKLCLFKSLLVETEALLSGTLNNRSPDSLVKDVRARLLQLEDLLRSIDSCCSYEPSLIDSHEDFQILTYSCRSLHSLFTAVVKGNWGIAKATRGDSIIDPGEGTTTHTQDDFVTELLRSLHNEKVSKKRVSISLRDSYTENVCLSPQAMELSRELYIQADLYSECLAAIVVNNHQQIMNTQESITDASGADSVLALLEYSQWPALPVPPYSSRRITYINEFFPPQSSVSQHFLVIRNVFVDSIVRSKLDAACASSKVFCDDSGRIVAYSKCMVELDRALGLSTFTKGHTT